MLITMIIMVLCASCADSRHETADSRAGGNADGGIKMFFVVFCYILSQFLSYSAIFSHILLYFAIFCYIWSRLVIYIDLYHAILCHILQ